MNRRITRMTLSILLAFGALLTLALGIALARDIDGESGSLPITKEDIADSNTKELVKALVPTAVNLTLDIRERAAGRYNPTYEPGSYFLYRIRLENIGNDDATGVRLTYTLPVSVSFSASFNDRDIPYTHTLPSTSTQEISLAWDVGDLEANGQRDFYVEMQIYSTATLGLDLVSTAVVTCVEQSPVQDQRTDTVTGLNLVLKKRLLSNSPGYLDKSEVMPGSEIIYRIEVENESVITDALNVVITDTLPSKVTFVSASTGGIYVSATHIVTWHVDTLPPGQTQSFLVTVLTPITPGLSLDNDAEATTSITETDTTDNDDTETVDVIALEPNVAVNYRGLNGSPVPGGVVEIRLDVDNFFDKNFARQIPVENVVVTQTLENGLEYITSSSRVEDGWGMVWPIIPTVVVSGDTTLTWNLGTLPNDPDQKLNDLTIHLWARISTSATIGNNLVVTAIATTTTQPESSTGDNDDQDTIQVEAPQPDLLVSKGGCGSPRAGEVCAYDLTVENVGNVPITDAILLDYLPVGLGVVGIDGGGCSPAVGQVTLFQGTLAFETQVATCTLKALAPGDTVDLQLYVNIPSSLIEGHTLTNTAIVTRTSIVSDVNPGDNKDVRVTQVQRPQIPQLDVEADIRVDKKILGGGDFVRPGETVEYEVSLRNRSSLVAENTVMTDTVLVHAALVNATGAEGINPVIDIPGNVATWDTGDRSEDVRFDVSVWARVDPDLVVGQSFANLAWASTTTTETDTADNYELEYNTIAIPPQESDLRVKKGVAGCLVPNSVVTFSIEVDNRRAITATNVVVTDTLSAGLIYQSSSIAPASTVGQDVIWHLGNVTPNQKVSFDVLVLLGTGLTQGDFLSNTVKATAGNEDIGQLDDNDDYLWLQVFDSAQADLDVQKHHAYAPPAYTYGQPAYRGLSFDYTISVRNRSNYCAAAGIAVWDVLPAGLSYVTASPIHTIVSGQVVTWNLGIMPAGGSTEIKVTVQVDPNAEVGKVLRNWAHVSSSTYDPDLENNAYYFNTAINDILKVYLPLILRNH